MKLTTIGTGTAAPHPTHVALTYFHADHIADLPMLLMAWRWGQLPPRSAPVTWIGPTGTRSLVERMAAVYGAWMLAPGYPLAVVEVEPGAGLALSSTVTLHAQPVPHTSESMAYSVGDGKRRLVLTHFYPPVEMTDIIAEVAERYAGPTVLATDGWSIDV